jgi:SAM-dependent methyltransferase
MEMKRVLERILEQPLVYRLSQAPFVGQKLVPILAHNDLDRIRRVLDVGCGPGINTPLFAHADYLGLDVNPKYIARARSRFGREFVVADATTYNANPGQLFDFILINSFLHHIDLTNTRRILSHLATLLTGDGHIHCIELVLPETAGLPRTMARLDRGRFCRPVGDWQEIFCESFETVVFEPFTETVFGIRFGEHLFTSRENRSGAASEPDTQSRLSDCPDGLARTSS